MHSMVPPPAPRRVSAHDRAPAGGWALHDSATARRLEIAAAAGLPPHTLMRRAGLAVARLALALAPNTRRVWVAAGPGNNGGDGLEAALHLHRAGKEVVVAVHPADTRPADATAALERARAAGVHLSEQPTPAEPLAPTDLAIDALFGLGATRPPRGWALDALHALSHGGAPVLAIDLPSGLDPDHGCCLAVDATVRARWTLSLLTLKPGLFTAAGRDHAGAVWFDGLGVPADTEPPVARLVSAADVAWPARHHERHKGSFGDLWVVGGDTGMVGAAVLAAQAGLAAGAGRVYLVALGGGAIARPEVMTRPPTALSDRQLALEDATVVCGCGGGAGIAAPLATLIGRAGRLLLDADALNALAADPALALRVQARTQRGRPTLLTPHPLEAARLLGISAADVQADRLGAARALATHLSATVVLKGSGSIVADATDCLINTSGNAALAGAGTGDVLAGWTAGLWSQGLAPRDAAVLGVFSHGTAADRWQAAHGAAAPLPATTLIESLGQAWGSRPMHGC